MGRLYADHLAHAIAVRMFFLGAKDRGPRTPAGVSALPKHLMRRVVERMHNLGTELNLETLAAETGYSRSHFLRMFRASSGVSAPSLPARASP